MNVANVLDYAEFLKSEIGKKHTELISHTEEKMEKLEEVTEKVAVARKKISEPIKRLREVGKHYVKIKGHGLFHTGANPLKLPVQKFGLVKDPKRGFSLQTRDKKGRSSGKLTLPIKSDLKVDPRTKDIEGVREDLARAGAKFGRTPLGTPRSHMQDLGYEGDSSHIQIF